MLGSRLCKETLDEEEGGGVAFAAVVSMAGVIAVATAVGVVAVIGAVAAVAFAAVVFATTARFATDFVAVVVVAFAAVVFATAAGFTTGFAAVAEDRHFDSKPLTIGNCQPVSSPSSGSSSAHSAPVSARLVSLIGFMQSLVLGVGLNT